MTVRRRAVSGVSVSVCPMDVPGVVVHHLPVGVAVAVGVAVPGVTVVLVMTVE